MAPAIRKLFEIRANGYFDTNIKIGVWPSTGSPKIKVSIKNFKF